MFSIDRIIGYFWIVSLSKMLHNFSEYSPELQENLSSDIDGIAEYNDLGLPTPQDKYADILMSPSKTCSNYKKYDDVSTSFLIGTTYIKMYEKGIMFVLIQCQQYTM